MEKIVGNCLGGERKEGTTVITFIPTKTIEEGRQVLPEEAEKEELESLYYRVLLLGRVVCFCFFFVSSSYNSFFVRRANTLHADQYVQLRQRRLLRSPSCTHIHKKHKVYAAELRGKVLP